MISKFEVTAQVLEGYSLVYYSRVILDDRKCFRNGASSEAVSSGIVLTQLKYMTTSFFWEL